MIFIVALAVLVINIPFGYWRKYERNLSIKWFLAIHIPVALSIMLRMLTGIDFQWLYLLLFIAVFFIGQLIGKLVYNLCKRRDVKVCKDIYPK